MNINVSPGKLTTFAIYSKQEVKIFGSREKLDVKLDAGTYISTELKMIDGSFKIVTQKIGGKK